MRRSHPARHQGILGLFALVGIVAVLVGMAPREGTARKEAAPAPATKPAVMPLFSWSEPAKNPVRLHVLADERRVVGWLNGADFSGQKVHVQADDTDITVPVNESNTFVWEYAVKQPTRATFRLGDLHRSIRCSAKLRARSRFSRLIASPTAPQTCTPRPSFAARGHEEWQLLRTRPSRHTSFRSKRHDRHSNEAYQRRLWPRYRLVRLRGR